MLGLRQKHYQPTLIFFHIPKTAGTSFTAVLEQVYGERLYAVSGQRQKADINHFTGLPQEQRYKFDAISGHRSDLLEQYVRQPVRYVTFLRDPVDLVISMFYYIQQTPHNLYHKQICKLKNIEEFLDWQQKNGFNNIQTRYLAGVDRSTLGDDAIDVDLGGGNGQSVLQKAQARLTQMITYTTDDMQTAIDDLGLKMGWSETPRVSTTNTSRRPRQEQLSVKTMGAIRRAVDLDTVLYEAAKPD